MKKLATEIAQLKKMAASNDAPVLIISKEGEEKILLSPVVFPNAFGNTDFQEKNGGGPYLAARLTIDCCHSEEVLLSVLIEWVEKALRNFPKAEYITFSKPHWNLEGDENDDEELLFPHHGDPYIELKEGRYVIG